MEHLKNICVEQNASFILTGDNCNHIAALSFSLMAIGNGHDVVPLIVMINNILVMFSNVCLMMILILNF